MATKLTCKTLQKARDDEPIFVLVAHDRVAPATVREWARRALALGSPEEKCREAMDCALDMELWQRNNGAKTPD